MQRVGLAILFCITVCLSGCSTSTPPSPAATAGGPAPPSVAAPVSPSSPEAKAKTSVAKYLSKRLNDPDSYKEAEWGELTPVTGCPNVTHYIQHTYRAKNKMGGYAPANEYFLLTKDLNVFFEVSQSDLDKIRGTQQFKDSSTAEIIRDFIDTPKDAQSN